MCGIVGYLGTHDSLPLLLEGLKRLEYRGYDSAGVAIPVKGQMKVYKAAGKLASFERRIGLTLPATEGIAHTRWATHGEPNDVNAHPHTDCTGKLALVHNGIIENHSSLKRKLVEEGHVFKTETDTEVLAHLIEKYLSGHGLEEAVSLALQLVEGTYGIAVAHADHPG